MKNRFLFFILMWKANIAVCTCGMARLHLMVKGTCCTRTCAVCTCGMARLHHATHDQHLHDMVKGSD